MAWTALGLPAIQLVQIAAAQDQADLRSPPIPDVAPNGRFNRLVASLGMHSTEFFGRLVAHRLEIGRSLVRGGRVEVLLKPSKPRERIKGDRLTEPARPTGPNPGSGCPSRPYRSTRRVRRSRAWHQNSQLTLTGGRNSAPVRQICRGRGLATGEPRSSRFRGDRSGGSCGCGGRRCRG